MHQPTQVLAPEADENPLLNEWGGRFGVPAFGRIRPDQFASAFTRAFASHAAEVAAIAASGADPSFANTIAALEASGEPRTRTLNIFNLLCRARTNSELRPDVREPGPAHDKH